MEEYKVVQRSDDCIQREGKKDVEEELEYQPKMEANIRTCSSKKSGEQAVDNDAGSTHKPLDRETVIHHLEEKVCTFAISPGNNHEMGYCYPILKSFMRNLTNEQWQALCKALKTPMTSEHFVKLCKTIVTFITQSTLHILLPTLARMLGETGCKGGDTDLPKRARSAKPFAAFQQERLELIREVKYLAKEMRTSGGGVHVFRSRTPTSLQSSVKVRGMPEENVIKGVQKKLSDHEILSFCPPELTVNLIQKVVEQLNSAFLVTIGRTISGEFSPNASAIQATEKMVYMFQNIFEDNTNPEDQLDVEPFIATATENLITVFEGLLDKSEKENPQSAKIFRDIAVKVKMLASGTEPSLDNLDAKVYPIPEDGLEGFVVSPSSIIQKLSLEDFQKKATNKVRKILTTSIESFLKTSLSSTLHQTVCQMSAKSTICSKHTAAAAFEIVGSISNNMKSLFLPPESSTNLWPADSVLDKNSKETAEASRTKPGGSQSGMELLEKKIWATAKAIFHSLQTKIRSYLIMERCAKATTAQAKETLGHILVSIYDVLSNSDQMSAADLSQIDNLIATMLDNIYYMSSSCGEEVISRDQQRPLSTLSSSSANSTISSKSKSSVRYFDSEWEFSLPGTPTLFDVPEVVTPPIVRSSVIDMSKPTKAQISTCDARKSMYALADSIMKVVYPEGKGQVMSHSDLAAAMLRLEVLISQGRVGALSRDLTHQINSIISDSNLSPLVLTVTAGKRASDTALDKLKDTKVGKPTCYELVHLFAEESVKCLLLPSLLPSYSKMGLAQGVSVPATVSEDRSSCSSGSSELIDIVNLFTNVLVSQVMESVVFDAPSRASSPTERLKTTVAQGFGNSMAGEKENANRCSDVAHNIECGRLSASPNALPLTPSSDHLDSDDFTSLISMLVVRLLTKIHSKTDLHSVDIAGRSQQLIPKVMAAFCAMSGYSETQAYPEKLNICKVYRAVYKHILEETGSEKILQMAMSTQDSQFERILVKSLSKELFDCCNQATRASSRTLFEATGPETLPLVEDVKANKVKFSFLHKFVRVVNPSKKNKKDCTKTCDLTKSKDLTTAEDILVSSINSHAATSAALVTPEDHVTSSEKEKPFVRRMFAAISKFMSRPFTCFSKRK